MGSVRVLIVEDDRNTRMVLRGFCEAARELVVCGEAADGWEGLDLLEKQEPDLILLDLIMPGMDGFGVLRGLMGCDEAKKPKVIVLSGISSDEYIQRACRMGADYYLVKPVNLDALAAQVDALFPARTPQCEQGLLSWLLLRMGADRQLEGFSYALTAMEFILDAEELPRMKEVYLQTAQVYSTSYACVEKNLRTLVRRLHSTGTTLYREVMGGDSERIPDNGTFLRIVTEMIKK